MKPTLQLFKAESFATDEAGTLTLANDADPREASLEGIRTVVLQFPKFSDGRAFSQAFLLRRRLGFTGEIRATGDVLIDQLAQMQRTGFTQAVLRADPEVIVASGMGEQRPEWLDRWQRWPRLTAVKRGNLFFVPPDLLQRHTPRLLDGAEQMCKALATARGRDSQTGK